MKPLHPTMQGLVDKVAAAGPGWYRPHAGSEAANAATLVGRRYLKRRATAPGGPYEYALSDATAARLGLPPTPGGSSTGLGLGVPRDSIEDD